MGTWEGSGQSSEWRTPAYIFDALGCEFDLDVAHPAPGNGVSHVPCRRFISADSLTQPWQGFIWMNPPFGGRNGLEPWLERFFEHGNGIALTPDRTSAPWWQAAAAQAESILFTAGKVRFLRPDGSEGKQPGNGTSLWAAGRAARDALRMAERNGLGCKVIP